MYSAAEVGVYLRIPRSTLSDWLNGRTWTIANGRKRSSPALVEPSEDGLLTFENLVELHVLRALFRAKIRPLRDAVDWIRDVMEVDRPLLRADLLHDGLQVVVKDHGELLSASRGGQVMMERIVESHLCRVERDEDELASRVYPFVRGAPRAKIFSIDPRVKFGRMCLAGTRITAEILWERHKAGESAEDLAEDYGQPLATIEQALAAAA